MKSINIKSDCNKIILILIMVDLKWNLNLIKGWGRSLEEALFIRVPLLLIFVIIIIIIIIISNLHHILLVIAIIIIVIIFWGEKPKIQAVLLFVSSTLSSTIPLHLHCHHHHHHHPPPQHHHQPRQIGGGAIEYQITLQFILWIFLYHQWLFITTSILIITNIKLAVEI